MRCCAKSTRSFGWGIVQDARNVETPEKILSEPREGTEHLHSMPTKLVKSRHDPGCGSATTPSDTTLQVVRFHDDPAILTQPRPTTAARPRRVSITDPQRSSRPCELRKTTTPAAPTGRRTSSPSRQTTAMRLARLDHTPPRS